MVKEKKRKKKAENFFVENFPSVISNFEHEREPIKGQMDDTVQEEVFVFIHKMFEIKLYTKTLYLYNDINVFRKSVLTEQNWSDEVIKAKELGRVFIKMI